MQIKFISSASSRPTSPLRKIVAFIMTLALAVVALMFSAVLLVFVLSFVVIGGIFLWWKTRELRKQLRAQMQNFPPPNGAATQGDIFAGEELKGTVIEGEVIRVDERRDRAE